MQGCRGILNWTLWFLPAIALSGVRRMVMRMGEKFDRAIGIRCNDMMREWHIFMRMNSN
jgi:hypothetical protein